MMLLKESRTVAVSVSAVLPTTHDVWHAVIGLVDVATDENDVDAAVGFTVTAAVCVIGPPPNAVVADAEIVFPCATVELSLAAYTPSALDAPLAAGLNVLAVPVEPSVTVAPLTRLLN